jgi:hypothetical protein
MTGKRNRRWLTATSRVARLKGKLAGRISLPETAPVLWKSDPMPRFFGLVTFTRLRWFLLSAVVWFPLVTAARAYTPESPEVRAMVKRAASYLEKEEASGHGVGAQALLALALYKAGMDTSHPKIRSAIAAARQYGDDPGRTVDASDTYVPAICCMFLVDVDPMESRPQIDNIVQGMLQRQHSSGSWTYQTQPYQDLSQTQYALLCLWAAHQMGLEISVDAVEKAAMWLVRSQHPEGGWSYRPLANVDPSTVRAPRHVEVTHSMSVAGIGSMYVCYHLLGFAGQEEQESENALPPALTKVEREEAAVGRTLQPRNTTARTLSPAIDAGNAWFGRNLTFDTPWWTHYYMYGLERYKSFQELVEGNPESEPAWYNQGVEFLQRTQRDDGTWQSAESPTSTAAIDTAFAVLFLTRSSRSMIQRAVFESGILIGGHGLPKNLTNVRLEDGKVVTPQMVRDVDDLLDLLKGTEDKEFDARALPGGLSLDEDLTKRTSQLERLRELVTDEDFHARFAAVKTLARSDDLDNVPALIYALTDGDQRIVHEANNGLRFISRKFMAHPLPPDPTIEQKWGVQAKWKAWLLSIQPDAEFLD